MTDDDMKALGSRRDFFKKMVALGFAIPVISSFSLEGVAAADQDWGGSRFGNGGDDDNGRIHFRHANSSFDYDDGRIHFRQGNGSFDYDNDDDGRIHFRHANSSFDYDNSRIHFRQGNGG